MSLHLSRHFPRQSDVGKVDRGGDKGRPAARRAEDGCKLRNSGLETLVRSRILSGVCDPRSIDAPLRSRRYQCRFLLVRADVLQGPGDTSMPSCAACFSPAASPSMKVCPTYATLRCSWLRQRPSVSPPRKRIAVNTSWRRFPVARNATRQSCPMAVSTRPNG